MLQAIREKAQGWIAWAIVILISIPFALWGIQEYLGVGGEPEVAVVNGDPITQRTLDQRTRGFRDSMRNSLGDSYDASRFEDSTLKPQVLEAIVAEKVIADAAADWNLRTSDQQARAFIASVPAFQRDGRFDQSVYEATLRNRGMTRAGFEQSVRQDMRVAQLRSGIRESAFVTERELATRVRLRGEKRKVSYVTVPAADYRDQVEVTPKLLRDYYDANPYQFRTPEQVKLAYLLLDASTLSGLVDVDEDALRQYFEGHRSEFVARQERAVRHILISVPPGADEATIAEARAKAEMLLQQLSEGARFEALAKQHSDDPGSADSGGDLGWVDRGIMVPAFEQAAFALEKNQVSEPVRTDFGFHLIEVTEIRGGKEVGFDEVREQVVEAYKKFEAENLYFDYAERLAEAAYENSGSLVPAAEALGLVVKTTGWITRDSRLEGALSSPKVINLAFADDVLIEGHNSELIESGPQQALVVRVAEHQPAGIKSFDEHQVEIEQAFREEQAAQAAKAAGTAALAELRASNHGLAELAATRGWTLEEPGLISRDALTVPTEVVRAAFDLAPPPKGEPRFEGVAATGGDYRLLEISEVQGGSIESVPVAERPRLSEQLAAEIAGGELQRVTQSLRARADVEIKRIDE